MASRTTDESWPASTGRITPTAEATVPMKDDGLYRGDGAFEVIRLYDGRPFALGDHLDRLERSAAAIELEFDRAALEREIEALLAEAGDADGQLRLIVTRGGRRIAAIEPIPAHAETLSVATVTYSPERDPQRGQVALLRGQHAGDAAGQGAGRRRGGPGQPDGTVLEPPTSSIFWVSPRAGCARPRSTSACSSRSPATAWSRRCTSRRAPGRSPTCAPPARPSSPRPRARSRRSPRSTARALPEAPGPAHPRGPGGLRRDPRPRALSLRTMTTRKRG